ncbi:MULTISPECIES: hypothetical protein [Pseudoalteromonas]|uniref:hypothetical protein n=1 Tax=Pseudoalteromonas TaxID=53246 RepID=UPI00384AAA34
MHKPSFILLIPDSLPLSFIDIDCDPSAERIIIVNRKNFELIAHKRIEQSRFTAILKFEYSISNDLMCIMLDDNNEFSAAIADNVQPMLINLITFDPTNPLPYEPPPA